MTDAEFPSNRDDNPSPSSLTGVLGPTIPVVDCTTNIRLGVHSDRLNFSLPPCLPDGAFANKAKNG